MRSTYPENPLAAAVASPGDTAALLRRARLAAGMTQGELARRVGRPQSMVSRWESGDHDITLSTLAMLASGMGAGVLITFVAEPGAGDA